METSGEEAYSSYNSEVNISRDELVAKMLEKYSDFNIDFGSSDAIQIKEYTEAGRVKTIKIGNKNISGVEARTLFNLKSAKFSVEIIENNIRFSVIGYGHGVGLSQTGSDSLAKQGKNILFIDSKSTVPSIGIRLFDDKAYEKNIEIVAENIKKLYHQIQRFEFYNPFSTEISQDKENYWGVVIVLEDSYIQRIHYYRKACELLCIKENSDEWQWIIKHIKVVSLYNIECICLCGLSIFDAFQHELSNNPFNYPFSGFPPKGRTFVDKNFLEFREKIHIETNKLVYEMRDHGILQ